MERVEQHIDVDAPIRAVYNQWTLFEDFPRFMEEIKEVHQLDPTHVHWRAEIAGKETAWDAEITEQDPDRRISWKSVSGASNAGTVRFESIDDQHTRVHLSMAYDPHGLVENIGDSLGIVQMRIERSLVAFKKFIEARGGDTGGWRGKVENSTVKS